ncbi:MAG: hypothetical protein JNN00_15465 [Chitinophagaceae bacterium]|nr:hypothetical protein [Chitinophagaceae bacterium]
MKKVILSIAAICYLAVTTGVMVNFHFCMNRLASTNFYSTEVKVCGKCGMDMHKYNGCCHNEVKILKMKADPTAAFHIVFELPSVDAPLPVYADLTFSYTCDVVKKDHHNHSPPLLSKQDTYLQNCVFRI